MLRVAGLALAIAQAPLAEPARAGSAELCGNAVIDAGEECDDGNQTDGDGCNSACRIRLCLSAPVRGCVAARGASFSVRQKITETRDLATLKLSLGRYAEELGRLDFGDPVFDKTRYDLCIYDQDDALVTNLIVDRGLQACGEKNKACWKLLRDHGYRYRDPERRSNGVGSLLLLGGAEGKGRIQVDARRTKDANALPRITQFLAGNTRASLQLMVGNGRCIGASLDDVKVADENRFRARTAPPPP